MAEAHLWTHVCVHNKLCEINRPQTVSAEPVTRQASRTRKLPLAYAAPPAEGFGRIFSLLFSVFRIVQLFCADPCCWGNKLIWFFLEDGQREGKSGAQVRRRSVWFEQTGSFGRGQPPAQRGLLEPSTGHLDNTRPSDSQSGIKSMTNSPWALAPTLSPRGSRPGSSQPGVQEAPPHPGG